MNKKNYNFNAALVLFFGAIVLYVISFFIDSPNLELFSRPVIIPTIYYYYYVAVKGKVNILFSIAMLCYFIGEILFMISAQDFLTVALIFFVIPYFITTFFLYQDFLYYLKKNKHRFNIFSFLIAFSLLSYLIYSVLAFITDATKLDFGLYVLFGLLLFVMCLLAFLIQLNYSNRTILFMILMVTSFFISDMFFMFSKMMSEVFALKFINIVGKQVSYLLFVFYFINRTKFYLWKLK